jgi:cobalt/nickel transport system permease protein
LIIEQAGGSSEFSYEVFDESARAGYDNRRTTRTIHRSGARRDMHIPNAVLDPRMAAATGVVGALGLAYGLRAIERRHGERAVVLMGSMSAFIFAAQMVNFPLGPLGVSGHLLGGTLAAVVLGPWAGAVVIAAVLIVQCLIFGDGGLLALGANFVNMGLIGSVIGYAIYAPIRRAIGGHRGILIGAMVASWFSVLLASGAFAIEFAALGNQRDFFRVLGWMALVHAGIGVGEALITGLVLQAILKSRPDLIHEPETLDSLPNRMLGWMQVGVAGLGVALAVAIFLAPFKSDAPDGLEYVGTKPLAFIKEDVPSPLPTLIPDYELPGLAARAPRLATAGAGAIGTLVVFGLSLAVAGVIGRRGQPVSRLIRPRPRPNEVPPDAA